ncbi:A/G-specific adenine glycosylase [Parasegetibacter sp. NRK P23]|uniref:A/G-specific adenine glycosylase n=1 Tax=Parasegetibacter sp. NRK P23 TaxID=2942999 RepID=UPI00204463EA|nr:A/G-specific adenine glycosylase [Parasegetibacter sp. NRK P23]MCM5529474.1 A/G-specific adenine glycosylase [Parasegetibacter sp. NRK P23]
MTNSKNPTARLLEWNRTMNAREMPWKGEKDPYRIWLSEIILQQTRVEQGRAYYERFITTYPTISALAKAPDDAVFKLWEGLGYYSRCRNLLFTARRVHSEFDGNFPSAYEDIISLKGVGAYTAAAIASFAFGLPHAVLDGNVFRVLSRYTGSAVPIDSTEGKKHFAALAEAWLDKKNPAEWNQAIMDFGALVCTPKQPSCETCPLNKDCVASHTNTVAKLPVKSKQLVKRTRYLNYVAASYNNGVYIRKRTDKDIWKDLHEFILIETDEPISADELVRRVSLPGIEAIQALPVVKHVLTHQTLHVQVVAARLLRKPELEDAYLYVPFNRLTEYAFPIVLKRFQEAKHFFLFT